MKFSPFSDEETCGRPVIYNGRDCACMRRAGHEGGCIAMMHKAGEADGVRWCCRVPAGEPHRDACPVACPVASKSTDGGAP